MSIRIALASSDGENVDRHFGHADRFFIYDISDTGYSFAEERSTAAFCKSNHPECAGNADGNGNLSVQKSVSDRKNCCRNNEHPKGNFEGVFPLLSDCGAVVAARVGDSAARHLFSLNKKVCQAAGPIKDILDEIIREHILDD